MDTNLDSELSNKVVLVIGGTSGIGLATAMQAKKENADVIILGRRPDRTAGIATQSGFDGWRAADILEPDQIETALTDITHVDHLVILAGSFISGNIIDGDIEDFRKIFEERFWSVIRILRVLDSRLAHDASITLVSGVLTERPNPHGTSVLCAATAAVEALARSLALELSPRRFNTVSPGPIETPLLKKALGEEFYNYVKSQKEVLPLHRIGTVDEVAMAIIFIIKNKYMNAATLNLDGGSRFI